MNADVHAAGLSAVQSPFESVCLFKTVCQHFGAETRKQVTWNNRFLAARFKGNAGSLKGGISNVSSRHRLLVKSRGFRLCSRLSHSHPLVKKGGWVSRCSVGGVA